MNKKNYWHKKLQKIYKKINQNKKNKYKIITWQEF